MDGELKWEYKGQNYGYSYVYVCEMNLVTLKLSDEPKLVELSNKGSRPAEPLVDRDMGCVTLEITPNPNFGSHFTMNNKYTHDTFFFMYNLREINIEKYKRESQEQLERTIHKLFSKRTEQ
jgi:hypothetical protein